LGANGKAVPECSAAATTFGEKAAGTLQALFTTSCNWSQPFRMTSVLFHQQKLKTAILSMFLVLMDEPAFPGCLLRCRVIGLIEGEQGKTAK
jgi:hypothetical protein